jgi:hypothetical protein
LLDARGHTFRIWLSWIGSTRECTGGIFEYIQVFYNPQRSHQSLAS